MFFTQIPNTALSPSVITLGVATYGSEISLDESFAMLDAFAEAGGNSADSAHIYAAWLPNGVGTSERTLGAWVNSRQPQGFIISTKGGHPHLDSMEQSRLSPECLASDVADSLERLNLPKIDLYWLHRDDPQIPVGEIVDALNVLRNAGHIDALGASNWSPERILAANEYAASRELAGFSASQIGWSLAFVNEAGRSNPGTLFMDDETLQWHREENFPAFAYSSQANGFFSYPLPGEESTRTPKEQALASSYLNPGNAARYERAGELAQKLGRTRPEVALASVWSQEFPSSAIVGCRTREQLADSLKAADLKLSAAQLSFVENGIARD
jgi:aryl-alcohol dehydrogenase-like predicted oxidoreductase